MHNAMVSLAVYDANERQIVRHTRSDDLQPLIDGWRNSIDLAVERSFHHGLLSVSKVALGRGYLLCLVRCDQRLLCPFYLCWREAISSAAWEAAEKNLTIAAREYRTDQEICWPSGPPPTTPWMATMSLRSETYAPKISPGELSTSKIGLAWALIDSDQKQDDLSHAVSP